MGEPDTAKLVSPLQGREKSLFSYTKMDSRFTDLYPFEIREERD